MEKEMFICRFVIKNRLQIMFPILIDGNIQEVDRIAGMGKFQLNIRMCIVGHIIET